jgi:hypothetical protein
MSENSLFKVDSITINGVGLAFEDGSARINGVAGYTSSVVASGSGPDFQSHQRVPRTIELNMQFGRAVNPDDLAKIDGARVVLKDTRAPRRCLATNCSFGSMGPVGGGTVQLTLNVLDPFQWL